jgi:DNA-binding transcriptional LysR family regulator
VLSCAAYIAAFWLTTADMRLRRLCDNPAIAFLEPAIAAGELEPVLQEWWQSFSGPFLYYPSRRNMPAPLRAFVDFIRAEGHTR